MKIAIVHNEPVPYQPDSNDVLEEVKLVRDSLERLEIPFQVFSLSAKPQAVKKYAAALLDYAPDAVVNLVEASGADPRLQAAAAGLLELLNLPYTGGSFSAILTTTDKVMTKNLLKSSQIPTPAFQIYTGGHFTPEFPGPWIVKPAWEDASVGIDDHSVIFQVDKLLERIKMCYQDNGSNQPILVEQFVSGREFNVSVLQLPDGQVEIMPPAEILFQEWPDDKPKIVNYKAKWFPEAFEYQHTPRSFEVESDLKAPLRKIGFDCWQAFQLSGYARVDLRMNDQGEFFVIEINSNPCIAADCGFLSACQQGGYAAHEVIQRLLDSALAKKIREVHR